MKRTLLLPAAAAFTVAFAVTVAPASGQSQQQQAQAPRAEGQSATYSEAQLSAYASAKVEIDRLGSQRTEAQTAPILQRHGLDTATYAAIERAATADRALSQRIASLTPQTRNQ